MAAENRLIETEERKLFLFFFSSNYYCYYFSLYGFEDEREYKYAKQVYIEEEEEMIQRSILLSQIHIIYNFVEVYYTYLFYLRMYTFCGPGRVGSG